MQIYFAFLLFFMAALSLGIGLKVVMQKRPLLLSSHYLFYFMVLALSSPQVVNSAIILSGHTGAPLIFLINPIIFICLLIFFWIQMKGYVLIGIHGDSFRDALIFSLNKNNMPFEERLSAIVLTEEKTELQVAIQSWIGSGQIKLKKSANSHVLKTIVDGINEYYVSNQIKPNNITSIFYVIIGILMLVCAVSILFVP